MKTTKFYPTIWQTIPYSFEVIDQWDAEGRHINDLVLRNSFASENGVSELELRIKKLSVFDSKGTEHFVTDFPEDALLNLKGLHTGHFIKSTSVLKLNPGEYRNFRFYVDKIGNNLKYSDRSTAPINGLDHFDFEIRNGLLIKGDEALEVILRFDFEPFVFTSYFTPIKQWFKPFWSLPAKMVNSLVNLQGIH